MESAPSDGVTFSTEDTDDEDFQYVRNARKDTSLETQASRAKSVAFSVIESELAEDIGQCTETRHYVTVSSRW